MQFDTVRSGSSTTLSPAEVCRCHFADLLPGHALQVSHDEMRAAMGLSPRPTSAPAGDGPRLTPPCAKVYLPKPSAPLPPGAPPFMGALSGYFGVSPPAAGVTLDAQCRIT